MAPAQGAVHRDCSRWSPPSTTTRGTGPAQEAGRARPARSTRAQPVERRQGPVVRAAAPGAGGRGPLRLHGGRPVPAHGPVRPLAARTASRESCTYDQLERAGDASTSPTCSPAAWCLTGLRDPGLRQYQRIPQRRTVVEGSAGKSAQLPGQIHCRTFNPDRSGVVDRSSGVATAGPRGAAAVVSN